MEEWNKENIKKLFPITIEIPQSLIDSKEPIGDQLLKVALPKELHEDIFWGLSIGSVRGVLIKVEKIVEYNGKSVAVPFYLQRSDILTPVSITFELRKINIYGHR